MKTKQEYLKILQISEENPSEQQIKTQYRKLYKIYHTDNVKTGDKDTFILITEAKNALINKTYAEKQPITSFSDLRERSDEVSQIINDKLSDFLNIAGENIRKENIKTKKKANTPNVNTKTVNPKIKTTRRSNSNDSCSDNEFNFLVIKKLNAKTIVIFDLTELTQDKSFIINRQIFNFKAR